jgi:hypothetical protein
MEFGLLRPLGRTELGINLPGVAVILDLFERLRTLERENQSLRNRR